MTIVKMSIKFNAACLLCTGISWILNFLLSDSDQFKSSQPPVGWVKLKLTNSFHLWVNNFETSDRIPAWWPCNFHPTFETFRKIALAGVERKASASASATALKFNLIPWSKPVSRHCWHGAIMRTYFKNTTYLTYMSSLFFLFFFLALNIKHFTQND